MKNFRDISIWRKGGIIGVGIYIMIILIPMFLPSNNGMVAVAKFVSNLPNIILGYTVYYIFPIQIFLFLTFIFGFVFYFMIGAITALIYGKIKNRNKNI